MSYKALLFCPDERTAKTVTQVLSELEFQVEACNEPFAAVKKLMAGHFDAVVVDCDNEQNATLLFKSARNSEFNQASLSVAVVEGQTGVAKAFRIGANLVLTKPINVEQSKGTLRVARGLLRKNEANKTSAKAPETPARSSFIAPPASIPAVPAPKPAFLTHAAPPLPPAAMASSSSAFEVEKDPVPEPEPAEAALLESMSDPLAGKSHASEHVTPSAKQYPWQPIPKPMAEPMTTALKHAADATGKPDSGISVGYGAAAAPAKEAATVDHEISALEEDRSEPSGSSAVPVAKPHSATSTVNWGRIAAIVLVAAAAGAIYRAGTQMHWQMPPLSSLWHRTAAASTPQTSKPAVVSPAAVTPATSSSPTAALSHPGAATVLNSPNASQNLNTGATPQKPSPATGAIAAGTVSKKPAVSATSFDPPAQPGVVKTIDEDTVFVNTQTPKPAPPKPAAAETVEPTAPDAVNAESHSNDQAISGLMSMPGVVPQPGPHTLRISQGVSQGLLINKVAPVYPLQAMKAQKQGSVQLLATISKDGDITNVKLLNGDDLLARAAIDAVKQWKYKPYLLDGQPMEIQTQITVNFTLPNH
ncbi:MAG: TonB family protein [Terriglobales bacterium]